MSLGLRINLALPFLYESLNEEVLFKPVKDNLIHFTTL